MLRRQLRLRPLTQKLSEPVPRLAAMAMPAPAYDDLAAFEAEVSGCTRCPLSQGRTQVVFGSGNPHADLMFVGAAGQLLSKLLAGIGLTREEVFVANVLKCRPPGNRDPLPEEIAACEGHLWQQLELIQPKLVATLGNFATKLLSGRPDGITRVHGRPQTHVLGGQSVTLYPIFHPAAALYTPRMLQTLEADFARIPELIGRPAGPPPAPLQAIAPAEAAAPTQPEQLGLF